MSVLGHLRHCRPGKPKLEGILALSPIVSQPPPPLVRPATATETTVVDLLSRFEQRVEQRFAEVGRVLGNHVTHLSAANAKPSEKPSLWSNPWVVGGGVLAGLGLLHKLTKRTPQLGAWPPPSRRDSDFDAMCDDLERLKAKGEDVSVPVACRRRESPVPVPTHETSGGFSLGFENVGEAATTLTKVLGAVKAAKGALS
jgi:hypothetical protein